MPMIARKGSLPGPVFRSDWAQVGCTVAGVRWFVAREWGWG